jgi:hypothetical protein
LKVIIIILYPCFMLCPIFLPNSAFLVFAGPLCPRARWLVSKNCHFYVVKPISPMDQYPSYFTQLPFIRYFIITVKYGIFPLLSNPQKYFFFHLLQKGLKWQCTYPKFNVNFYYIHSVTPQMFSMYKLAIQLYKMFNYSLLINEWTHLNFDQQMTSCQKNFLINIITIPS